jgi:hypothetical protein
VKLLAEAFPECNTLPKLYNEANNLLNELGLGYDSIHVCFNNKDLFRKQYDKLDDCPICGFQDGKIEKERRFHRKCCGTFHWHLG